MKDQDDIVVVQYKHISQREYQRNLHTDVDKSEEEILQEHW